MKTKTQKLKFKRALFSIDALEGLYEGYYIPLEAGEELVNPIVPYFPLEVGKQIAAELTYDEWEIFFSEVEKVFVSIPRNYGVEFTEISKPIDWNGIYLFDFSFTMNWEKYTDLD